MHPKITQRASQELPKETQEHSKSDFEGRKAKTLKLLDGAALLKVFWGPWRAVGEQVGTIWDHLETIGRSFGSILRIFWDMLGPIGLFGSHLKQFWGNSVSFSVKVGANVEYFYIFFIIFENEKCISMKKPNP